MTNFGTCLIVTNRCQATMSARWLNTAKPYRCRDPWTLRMKSRSAHAHDDAGIVRQPGRGEMIVIGEIVDRRSTSPARRVVVAGLMERVAVMEGHTALRHRRMRHREAPRHILRHLQIERLAGR